MYLVLENLVKTFPSRGGVGEVTAVDGVSLEIEQGELVTLLGPSGCGKTTTLRLIAGFEFPTQGRILLDGRAINDLPPHQRDMSMVFQSYAIFPHLNVFENIAYGLNVQQPAAGRDQAPRGEGAGAGGADRATRTARPTSFPAASSSAWRWRAPWSWSRRCC